MEHANLACAPSAGDSFTTGWGNLGNGSCELLYTDFPYPKYQDASRTWGALTAAEFTADLELLAWSGSGVNTYSLVEVGFPSAEWPALEPKITDLFEQVVAGDNSTLMSDFGTWVPQVWTYLYTSSIPLSLSLSLSLSLQFSSIMLVAGSTAQRTLARSSNPRYTMLQHAIEFADLQNCSVSAFDGC